MQDTDPLTAAAPMLSVENLRKVYGDGADAKVAIEDVSFSVSAGEFVCVVGPSGAGKTTLLNCLTGLIGATGGELRFAGDAVTEPPEGLAVVFQDYGRSLFPWLSVGRNVSFPLKGKGLSAKEIVHRVEEALTAVGLQGTEHRHPWQLSGGMQQRVALARALAYKPECLVLDEPFASVDAQTRFELEDLLLRVRSEFGITVVFVTHDIDEAVYLSDRVVVLSRSPAVVRSVLDIGLPRPRDQVRTKSDPRFATLRSLLFEQVQTQHEPAAG